MRNYVKTFINADADKKKDIVNVSGTIIFEIVNK